MSLFLRRGAVPALLLLGALATASGAPPATHETQNIIFVMSDGLRWQEIFHGADATLMTKENGGVENPAGLKKTYWRESEQARREALMPFLWTVIARQGQIYGNPKLGSESFVTNGKNFSYPGYSETLCGFPDPRIDSNDKVPNPNVTVLEWLHNKPAYRGKVAAFGAWDTFAAIFNAGRAGFPVVAGFDPLTIPPVTPKLELLNQLKLDEPRFMGGEPVDALPFYTAMEYLQAHKPRVLYLSLGETDEWAHEGNYEEYLDAAHRADAYLKTLWETVQAMPEYKNHTALIFSPDHGRGEAPLGWKDHGEKVPDSKYIWMAFLGPDTPALGERSKIEAVTQNQIAATLAALLGEDYRADVPKAGAPIADVLGKR
ncbi:MAG: hypothetical protein P4K98_02595 [Bryobacteraceae bacterium]|nr:hypothetical protein [Bryobacteraceae bacterium]